MRNIFLLNMSRNDSPAVERTNGLASHSDEISCTESPGKGSCADFRRMELSKRMSSFF